jgi:hypothetical protein
MVRLHRWYDNAGKFWVVILVPDHHVREMACANAWPACTPLREQNF